jgi:hypothetical protein
LRGSHQFTKVHHIAHALKLAFNASAAMTVGISWCTPAPRPKTNNLVLEIETLLKHPIMQTNRRPTFTAESGQHMYITRWLCHLTVPYPAPVVSCTILFEMRSKSSSPFFPHPRVPFETVGRNRSYRWYAFFPTSSGAYAAVRASIASATNQDVNHLPAITRLGRYETTKWGQLHRLYSLSFGNSRFHHVIRPHLAQVQGQRCLKQASAIGE